ncbi:hypothetical protein GA0070622_2658 [Micromonospora sediminicola]|uniref:Uncharacterized protein n=1 Tax=Micromonospora sediminicola TaxID=946078 RepID=A0A1A9B9T5_9ACTN|nr:hypothetical protein [Micromonospora sediminicola]SBT65657.1 hypothetical protein GA0070622_2658 [Micromonospora sediminicola]
MSTVNGTPLTRHGSRVPATPTRPASAKAMPAAAPRPVRTRPTATARPTVTPAPTIATMIICLPDALPAQALTSHQLDTHFNVTGTLTPQFWAVPQLRVWQRQQLIGLRKGRPAPCAGGPVRLLDLHGMRHAAALGAGIRYQIWQQIVHGTRAATPWPLIETRHLTDPDRYPLDTAIADFHAQPRVHAMRLHAAAAPGPGQPSVGELEMYQAGQMAYQHYRAASAVAGDAMLTADGRKLAPESDALAHRITYLEQALAHLDTLDPDQRLLSVAL